MHGRTDRTASTTNDRPPHRRRAPTVAVSLPAPYRRVVVPECRALWGGRRQPAASAPAWADHSGLDRPLGLAGLILEIRLLRKSRARRPTTAASRSMSGRRSAITTPPSLPALPSRVPARLGAATGRIHCTHTLVASIIGLVSTRCRGRKAQAVRYDLSAAGLHGFLGRSGRATSKQPNRGDDMTERRCGA